MSKMSKMSNTTLECFINSCSNGWERARSHHKKALDNFLNKSLNNFNERVKISVPHEDGGDFVGIFRNVNYEESIGIQLMYLPMSAYEKERGNVQSMAVYTDSSNGSFVEIMVANPKYMDSINSGEDM